jgi:hypothetical protein
MLVLVVGEEEVEGNKRLPLRAVVAAVLGVVGDERVCVCGRKKAHPLTVVPTLPSAKAAVKRTLLLRRW